MPSLSSATHFHVNEKPNIMKTRLLLLLAIAALASCTHDSAKLYVPRDGEHEDARHSKGSWIPHNA